MGKERLDVLLVERGLAESREKAKTTIMAGLVLVDGQKTDKAGTMVKKEAGLRVLGDAIPYVSRGGLKLAKAIDSFDIELKGRIVADIGASTGGFTDCALQNGLPDNGIACIEQDSRDRLWVGTDHGLC
ncbi:MAG: SAM-dependent methyltransferase, partial [Negativicutes bacterium]